MAPHPTIPIYPGYLTSDEPTDDPHDQQMVSYLRNRLQEAGFRTDNCFALIMTAHEGKTYLAGWTQNRWDRASAPQQSETG